MSVSRTIVILTVVALPFALAGYMTGRAAPVADSDQKMKASFEALQKKLPGLVEKWAKKEVGAEPKQVKTEIKLARLTGTSDAKIILLITLNGDNEVSLYVSFYLRYFDGKWTTNRADAQPKWVEAVGSLMPAIDLAGDK